VQDGTWGPLIQEACDYNKRLQGALNEMASAILKVKVDG